MIQVFVPIPMMSKPIFFSVRRTSLSRVLVGSVKSIYYSSDTGHTASKESFPWPRGPQNKQAGSDTGVAVLGQLAEVWHILLNLQLQHRPTAQQLLHQLFIHLKTALTLVTC